MLKIRYDDLPADMQVLILQLVEDEKLGPGDLPGFALTPTVLDMSRVTNPVYSEVGECGGDERTVGYALGFEGALAPVILAGNRLLDGKHRCHFARHKGLTSLTAIDLCGYPGYRPAANVGRELVPADGTAGRLPGV